MKILHPNCSGKGCGDCCDGYVEGGFAEGDLYIRKCTDGSCRFENGGFIAGPETAPLPDDPGQCILCGSECEWIHVAVIEDE